MLLLPTLLVLVLFTLPTRCTAILCSSNLYGQPSISDVAAVVQAIPFARSDPDGQMDASRIFAEPAFFTPSFSALKNGWPSRMVQLPMIWRFKTARFALLMYADADGNVRKPILTMDWRTIRSATVTVESRCVDGLHSGGVWIVSDIFRDPHVAVYLYEAGSPFETVVTQYMISGKGVNPFNPGGLGLKTVQLNVTVPGAVLSASAAMA